MSQARPFSSRQDAWDRARQPRLGWAWCGVLALALAVRIPLVLQPACIDRNGVQFVEFARQLDGNAAHAMKETRRQPGFAALLLWTHALVGGWLGGDTPESWQRCGELLALAGGAAACVGAYWLARRLFDGQVALLGGVLAALWPQGAQMSAQVLSDMPHLALYLLALLLAYAALQTGRITRLAAAGFVAGACYLMRQEAIGLLAAVASCWIIGSPRTAAQRWAGLAALLGCFVGVVAPHSILTGQWIPNKGPADLLKLINDTSSSTPPSAPLLAYTALWWKTPGQLIEWWAKSGRYAISTLFLLGVFLKSAPPAETHGRRLVATAAVLHVLLVVVRAQVYGDTSDRYVVIPVALSIPWAASGWLSLLRLAGRRVAARRRMYAAILLAPLVPMAIYLVRPVYPGKEPLRLAGLWLRAHADRGDRILAHEHLEQIMFYADRSYPARTWIKCARRNNANRLAEIIAREQPAWFVDAEDSHRDELDERAHFAALQNGAVPVLAPAFTIGPPNRRVYGYRVLLPTTLPR